MARMKRLGFLRMMVGMGALSLVGFAEVGALAAPAHQVAADSVLLGARQRLNDVKEFNEQRLLPYGRLKEFERVQQRLVEAARAYRSRPSRDNADRMSRARSRMRLSFWDQKVFAYRSRLHREVQRGTIHRFEERELASELDIVAAVVSSWSRTSKIVPLSVADQVSNHFAAFDRKFTAARRSGSRR